MELIFSYFLEHITYNNINQSNVVMNLCASLCICHAALYLHSRLSDQHVCMYTLAEEISVGYAQPLICVV